MESSSDEAEICHVCGYETEQYWLCDVCDGVVCTENCGYCGCERCGRLHCEPCWDAQGGVCCPDSDDEEEQPTPTWVLLGADLSVDVCRRVMSFTG